MAERLPRLRRIVRGLSTPVSRPDGPVPVVNGRHPTGTGHAGGADEDGGDAGEVQQ